MTLSRNLRCTLAYVGTHYFGWQKVKIGPTIEEAVETCLSTVLQHPIALQAASRTDRGVHAEGQVINFFTHRSDLSLGTLFCALRKMLPRDISLLDLSEAEPLFHPTLDARGKEYHYQVCTHSVQLPFHRECSWHFPFQSLDLEAMEKGGKQLEGTHDFAAFSPLAYEDSTRTIERVSIISLDKGRLLFQIRGDRFLYRMARNLVGTLMYIGCGKIPLQTLPTILEQRSRALAGVTAPAHGLTLKRVFY